jgi:hypothetical protein
MHATLCFTLGHSRLGTRTSRVLEVRGPSRRFAPNSPTLAPIRVLCNTSRLQTQYPSPSTTHCLMHMQWRPRAPCRKLTHYSPKRQLATRGGWLRWRQRPVGCNPPSRPPCPRPIDHGGMSRMRKAVWFPYFVLRLMQWGSHGDGTRGWGPAVPSP